MGRRYRESQACDVTELNNARRMSDAQLYLHLTTHLLAQWKTGNVINEYPLKDYKEKWGTVSVSVYIRAIARTHLEFRNTSTFDLFPDLLFVSERV